MMANKIYAQVLKENMRVNLIGGKEVGLYPFDLRLAFTVDVTDRPGVKVGMKYNPSLGDFEADESAMVLAEPDREPTADEILNALLGVTE
jgi:hypothetical protein